MESGRDVRYLKTTLQRLAAPAREQVKYLRDLGTYPSLDELALEFDDALSPVRHELDALTVLRELDELLHRMSGPANAELWEPGALTGDEWQRVRALAASALASLPE